MTLRQYLIALCAVPALLWAAQPDKLFVKSVEFPAEATVEQKIDMASRLVPSSKQLQWQQLELTAFIHFGINTFTGREWGDGSESPAIFNPAELDADQWVRTLSEAGFRLVILTAKHHDGFCLWPTATTEHSVKSSPWRNGKGDVMADLRRACDKYGMKLGVYLSPWDRNAACYGYSHAYNDMFVAQLTELLTDYGRIDEVWFDGACGEGPNGKKQVYDWERFRTTIERLQPEAVVAIMGDDVRWVGNEKGMGRETEWSATALTPGIYPESDESNSRLGIYGKARDLGSRDIVARAHKLYWWPSEVDVSIRPGWFYHDTEQPKSLRSLAEIYLNSVGRNSVLLLNIPPDRRGLIDEKDVARLQELRAWIDSNLKPDLVCDFNRKSLTGNFKNRSTVNAVTIGEDISKGQHVESFDVEALVDGQWRKVSEGTTIGLKRILVFPELAAEAVRVRPLSVRGKANIDMLRAHYIALPAETGTELPGYRAMPTTDWLVTDCSGDRSTVYRAFDGSDGTFWQSEQSAGEKSITVDTRRNAAVAGFVYTPRGGDDKAGTVYHYRFELSTDGKQWHECAVSGEFSNIAYNPLPQRVYLPAPVEARY
ncbi:MAG: alpha-L-fucosidase, partial [Muribaculaceae bacterium]|nr:alpha-L-fucosidase [Muribaculaceae bacterium]